MHRAILSAVTLLAGAAFSANAQTPAAPMVIYSDGLASGWQNWSWGATVTLQVPAGGVQPIKVDAGTPWSALDLHHDAFSTAGYSKLTFYINGGVDGGQTLTVHIKTQDGKSPDATYTFQPKVKSWNLVEVPLADIGAANATISDVYIQGGATDYKAYYVDKIQLEP